MKRSADAFQDLLLGKSILTWIESCLWMPKSESAVASPRALLQDIGRDSVCWSGPHTNALSPSFI